MILSARKQGNRMYVASQLQSVAAALVIATAAATGQTPPDTAPANTIETVWSGVWISDQGVLELTQSEQSVTGTYGKQGKIDAKVEGNRLNGKYENGNTRGEIEFTLAQNNREFEGKWKGRSGSGPWRGWRKSPDAELGDQKLADFSGNFLSSSGILQLEQDGANVNGTFGSKGWGKVTGTVTGGRLDFEWRWLQSKGQAWLEQTENGKTIFGATASQSPKPWTGLRVDDFERNPIPTPGKTVQGIAENGLLYFLRMPDADDREPTKRDVVVLLHGSNWTTRGMVPVTAKNWPDIGRRFAIVGIQGDRWADWSTADDLRFNYFYVNWMGRSTYRGFPNTDRDSPHLVMQVIDELKNRHNLDRVFVGGHSQGGYMTYLLHMHYPEKIAGTFPVAGGMVMQAEPDVFNDEQLKANQRATPMAIVHGKRDQVVPFSRSEHIQRRLLAHDFGRFTFLQPNADHPFDFLPIGDAIKWLDVMSTSDDKRLTEFMQQAVKDERWRDVASALKRATEIDARSETMKQCRSAFEAAAAKRAAKFAATIDANDNGEWIEDFLPWYDQFSSAESAAKTVAAFHKLQTTHDAEAKELMSAARKAFRAGNRNGGWKKYQEIIDRCYASRLYRTTKAAVDNR